MGMNHKQNHQYKLAFFCRESGKILYRSRDVFGGMDIPVNISLHHMTHISKWENFDFHSNGWWMGEVLLISQRSEARFFAYQTLAVANHSRSHLSFKSFSPFFWGSKLNHFLTWISAPHLIFFQDHLLPSLLAKSGLTYSLKHLTSMLNTVRLSAFETRRIRNWLVVDLVIYKVFYISSGCLGFLPSTVSYLS